MSDSPPTPPSDSARRPLPRPPAERPSPTGSSLGSTSPTLVPSPSSPILSTPSLSPGFTVADRPNRGHHAARKYLAQLSAPRVPSNLRSPPIWPEEFVEEPEDDEPDSDDTWVARLIAEENLDELMQSVDMKVEIEGEDVDETTQLRSPLSVSSPGQVTPPAMTKSARELFESIPSPSMLTPPLFAITPPAVEASVLSPLELSTWLPPARPSTPTTPKSATMPVALSLEDELEGVEGLEPSPRSVVSHRRAIVSGTENLQELTNKLVRLLESSSNLNLGLREPLLDLEAIERSARDRGIPVKRRKSSRKGEKDASPVASSSTDAIHGWSPRGEGSWSNTAVVETSPTTGFLKRRLPKTQFPTVLQPYAPIRTSSATGPVITGWSPGPSSPGPEPQSARSQSPVASSSRRRLLEDEYEVSYIEHASSSGSSKKDISKGKKPVGLGIFAKVTTKLADRRPAGGLLLSRQENKSLWSRWKGVDKGKGKEKESVEDSAAESSLPEWDFSWDDEDGQTEAVQMMEGAQPLDDLEDDDSEIDQSREQILLANSTRLVSSSLLQVTLGEPAGSSSSQRASIRTTEVPSQSSTPGPSLSGLQASSFRPIPTQIRVLRTRSLPRVNTASGRLDDENSTGMGPYARSKLARWVPSMERMALYRVEPFDRAPLGTGLVRRLETLFGARDASSRQ